MSDIFRKTALGYEEIATRSLQLNPRLRRCLIMIDGKRSIRQLMALLQGEDLSTLIQALELDQFIELIGTANDSPVDEAPSQSRIELSMETRMDAAPAAAPSELATPDNQPQANADINYFIDSAGLMRRKLGFADKQARALRVLNELLSETGFSVMTQIEQCRSDAQLDPLLRITAALLADNVNDIAAQRFRDHVRLPAQDSDGA